MKKTINLLFCLVALSSCFQYGWTENGPYHHDAAICLPKKVVEIDEKVYCNVSGKIYELKNNKLVQIEFKEDWADWHCLHDFCYTGSQVFISTDFGTYIYDNDFKFVEKIEIELGHSMLYYENVIYYNNRYVNDTSFCSYNLITKEKKFLATAFIDNEYNLGDKTIYSNCKGVLSFEYSLNEIISSFCYPRTKKASIKYNGELVSFYVDNGKLNVEYQNETVKIPVSDSASFFESLYIENNKLFFSIFDAIEKEDCIAYNCICSIGESKVVSFDFLTKKLVVEKELKEKSFVISIDSDGTTYYYDGGVYINDNLIFEVNKIEEFGEYIYLGQPTRMPSGKQSVSVSSFCKYKDEIYYYYVDYSDSLISRY